MTFLLLGSVEAFAAPSGGGPPPKPACGTSGALQVTDPDPSSYSYIRTTPGSGAASFTVSSPAVTINASCDSSLPPVYGNGKSVTDEDGDGNGANDIDVAISVGTVTVVEPVGDTLTGGETALKSAFGFAPSFFNLTNPGTGSQTVGLTFTNTDQVPEGKYDVTINVDPEAGAGVGAATKTFTVIVSEPTAVDTLPPDVDILSPVANSKLCLNGNLGVSFTAEDPEEGGAGTGITAVRASIASNGGVFTDDLTDGLLVNPTLPVLAGVTVTATTDYTVTDVGSFVLMAEADDAAAHTGEAVSGYTVALNVNALPPMSVAGRQFKVGSTLPIKWSFTDCEGNLLPAYASVSIDITAPDDSVSMRVAGDGAANIRWELDASGNVLHYITNYPIPLVGSYTVDVYVNDVDGNPAKQGLLSFIASTKGGK